MTGPVALPLIIVADLLTNMLTHYPYRFQGDSGADRAEEHVVYAERASAESGLPASLLLAIAAVESDFDPTATSRVVGDKRVTGSWRSSSPTGRGPRFCGVMQTIAGTSWATCLAHRDLETGYLVGAQEIVAWLEWTNGDLRAALRGHACGVAGAMRKVWCKNYEGRVLRVKALLEREP